MSDYVNDALLGASPYKKQQDEAKALVNKWDKTGLLDGLNEDFQKSGMAVMLENQAKQLISENSATGGGAGGHPAPDHPRPRLRGAGQHGAAQRVAPAVWRFVGPSLTTAFALSLVSFQFPNQCERIVQRVDE